MTKSWIVEWWQILLIVLVGFALLAAMAWQNREITKNIDRQVDRHGWQRTANSPELLTRWPGPPFELTIGYGHKACNVISGSYRGHDFVAFDFRYEMGPSANSTGQRGAAVIAVTLPRPTQKRAETRAKELAEASDNPIVRKRLLAVENRRWRYRCTGAAVLSWEDMSSIEAGGATSDFLEKRLDLLLGVAQLGSANRWPTPGS